MTSDLTMQDVCDYCYHKKENHMPFHNARTDCDFPDCHCQGFENQISKSKYQDT